ncbi:hypothetical protein [Streptomyces sp. NPDC004285]
MPERTQLSQQDEALRQARIVDAARDGILAIADHLARNKADRLMDPSHRLHEARTTATRTYPHDRDAAVELERQLLQRMPFIDGRTVTRGEYALWLRKTSWGA